jgi:hypothetical protein
MYRSDPMEEDGVEDNPRGAGVCFGPDIAETFMKNNKVYIYIYVHIYICIYIYEYIYTYVSALI